MSKIMRPQVADMFYPGDPVQLREMIKSMLGNAGDEVDTYALPKAMILPHAGYVYSGAIAAKAYGLLANYMNEFDKVVIIGPAHRLYVLGVTVPTWLKYQTPFGYLNIDQNLKDLALNFAGVEKNDAPYVGEHCLEVQMPFLQYISGCSNLSILPLLVGDADIVVLAKVIHSLMLQPRVLIIVSSDLSHFLDYEAACAVDAKTNKNILSLSPEELTHNDACGCTIIKALLTIARNEKLTPELLAQCNSGDVFGDKSRVVGYAAYQFT